MNATEILSKNITINIKKVEQIQTKCSLCGKEVDKAVNLKNVVSDNFTNYEFFKYKTDYICVNCAKCIKDDKLRKHNFIADNSKIILFKQLDIEKYIFNIADYIEVPFVFAITRSFKKHNSFKCNINYDYNNFYIQEEDRKYIFYVKEMKNLYEILNIAYLNFTKDELITGNYNFYSIEKYGLENFKQLEETLKRYRGTHQFDLLIYMLNSEKRNEYIKKKKEEELCKKKNKK